jgi:hypothetical protein
VHGLDITAPLAAESAIAEQSIKQEARNDKCFFKPAVRAKPSRHRAKRGQ